MAVFVLKADWMTKFQLFRLLGILGALKVAMVYKNEQCGQKPLL